MPDTPSSWITPDWPAPANVRAVVTTRGGGEVPPSSPYGFNVGARCGDAPVAVAENRALLVEALSLPSAPRWLRQVHGTHVAVDPDTLEPEADAAVTRAHGVVLAIQTADCLPVLFCSDDGSEIAAAHAGWRGLSAGVLENTLGAMRTPRVKVMAWLGPAIDAPSYEVGGEVREAFLACDSAAATVFTATRPGHWLCDLYALALQRLQRAGVAHVFRGGLDTFTDPRLHSYRRDGARSGRMASLIWVQPSASSLE
ncbi:MAG: peptidoglycan editing factor PgeF [Rhodanobacteraceae bacterium]|nr:MAG: peptidoglycan editing factor PgeF [Rhodanobacteraceae bacterium]